MRRTAILLLATLLLAATPHAAARDECVNVGVSSFADATNVRASGHGVIGVVVTVGPLPGVDNDGVGASAYVVPEECGLPVPDCDLPRNLCRWLVWDLRDVALW